MKNILLTAAMLLSATVANAEWGWTHRAQNCAPCIVADDKQIHRSDSEIAEIRADLENKINEAPTREAHYSDTIRLEYFNEVHTIDDKLYADIDAKAKRWLRDLPPLLEPFIDEVKENLTAEVSIREYALQYQAYIRVEGITHAKAIFDKYEDVQILTIQAENDGTYTLLVDKDANGILDHAFTGKSSNSMAARQNLRERIDLGLNDMTFENSELYQKILDLVGTRYRERRQRERDELHQLEQTAASMQEYARMIGAISPYATTLAAIAELIESELVNLQSRMEDPLGLRN